MYISKVLFELFKERQYFCLKFNGYLFLKNLPFDEKVRFKMLILRYNLLSVKILKGFVLMHLVNNSPVAGPALELKHIIPG